MVLQEEGQEARPLLSEYQRVEGSKRPGAGARAWIKYVERAYFGGADQYATTEAPSTHFSTPSTSPSSRRRRPTVASSSAWRPPFILHLHDLRRPATGTATAPICTMPADSPGFGDGLRPRSVQSRRAIDIAGRPSTRRCTGELRVPAVASAAERERVATRQPQTAESKPRRRRTMTARRDDAEEYGAS